MAIHQSCLDCRTIQSNGSRCAKCQARRDGIRSASRPHYNGSYRRRAAQVRDEAQFCWLCGEGERAHDPWTADHVVAGDPDSILLPAHRSCNSRRGNRPVEIAAHARASAIAARRAGSTQIPGVG